MIKESFDWLVQNGLAEKENEPKHIEMLVNMLIQNFYTPTESKLQFVADNNKVERWAVDMEPINWGDLKCISVEKIEDRWLIIIDEADPECQNFCEYIFKYLTAWGWNVEVKTEW